ncbi:MAG: hypothetical protein ABIL06_14505, partial [Pseudomonadota bacterium]
MATKDQLNQLTKLIKPMLELEKKSLVVRPEWGAITFKNAEQDLQRIFSLLNYLDVLPLEYLPENVANNIISQLNQSRGVLGQIDGYNIEQPNATQTRDGLVQQIHAAVESLYNSAALWLPFLAYQKGDVTQNIAKLSASVAEASGIIDKAKNDIEKKAKEIDEIIIKAREASAEAGAAVFT